MWNLVSIPLDANGAGNANLFPLKTRVLGKVAVPQQTAITSNSTKMVISDILPNVSASAFALLTLNTFITPYCEVINRTPVGPTGAAQSNYQYQMVGGLNISITGGVANQTAVVAILLSDD